ncbi:MAG: 6-phosphofructokinase [Candidatus Atribacteria bacterium]|nr:MAG: 6-phosphofructokinase [Candidatus Atribacteria bacterium]
MADRVERIGIITSGGDCGGLNAIIKGAALAGTRHNIRSFVIPHGYAGLYNLVDYDALVELTPERLTHVEATIAGSDAGHSRVKLTKIEDAGKYDRIRAGLEKFAIDALVISGGDDTGSVILDLAEHGIRCVHAPKTMDLDLQTYSVGADSTISRIATYARDLKTTGQTHNRVIVMEVFGRYAGHTAFRGGLAAEADAILIPEIAVDFDIVCAHMKKRYFDRIRRSDVHAGTYLVVVAEGLRDASGAEIVDEAAGVDAFGHKRLAGAGAYVRNELKTRLAADPGVKETMKEVGMFIQGLYETPEIRTITPGHLVRCGQTSAFDVNFGIEAGAAAVELLVHGLNSMTVVDVRGRLIRYMTTAEAIKQRHVDLDLVGFHERLGVCFGRVPHEIDLQFAQVQAPVQRHM